MFVSNWRKEIKAEMKRHGDSWDNVVSSTLTDEELDEEFDSGYGSPKGKPFTVWTVSRVYFPTEYDGAEGCGSVARFPDGKATEHI